MTRSLWPREHGAYAQLAAPLVAALAGGAPGVAAALLTIAAGLAFLAHEPLLVVLGHRGRRAKEQAGALARRRMIALAAAAIAAGTAGLALAPDAARLAAAIVGVPVAATLALAARRAEHSAPGEVVAAIALSGAALPVALASGWTWTGALVAWGAWSGGFTATVIAVHRVIARHKRPPSRADALAGGGLAAATAAAVAASWAAPIAAAAAPLVVLSTALVVRPPRATRLRAVGVALAIATTVSAAVVVVVARLG